MHPTKLKAKGLLKQVVFKEIYIKKRKTENFDCPLTKTAEFGVI